MADFGWKPGFSQLGSHRISGGLGFVYAPRGECSNPAVGTVEAWIGAYAPWTIVRMADAYEPAYVTNFPTRTAVRGGDVCQFPSIEADALVAAGLAAYAPVSGTPILTESGATILTETGQPELVE